jgi:putative ABC transport system ATP-binding protein
MRNTDSEKPHISIINIEKNYENTDGSTINVININELIVEKGEKVCIKGASGSGKSTFLNMIAGIILPDRGSVIINNIKINELKEHKRDRFRAANIGYIFQEFNLLQGFTALENVLIAMHFKKKTTKNDENQAKSLLKRAGIGNRINHKPSQLSYGQQQRVAIARALANNPGLILADEPTGSLDKQNKLEILQLIEEMIEGSDATLLIATHDEAIFDKYPRIIEL